MRKAIRHLAIPGSILLITAIACSSAPAASEEAAPTEAVEATQEPVTIRMALLPIVDAMPMYVAEAEGLFAAHNLKVEFIPVASAPERVQLMASGEAEGTINETLAVMLFNRESTQMQVVRYAFRPYSGVGHFFILASGASGISEAEGLKNVDIGVSQGTIIEYVTDRLLEAQGLSAEEINTIAVPSIADRMALLAAGDLPAGVLPDPLASLAMAQGATLVIDDSEYPEYGFSVISFRKEFIDQNMEAVRAFLLAIEEATELINADAQSYSYLFSEYNLVPAPLLESYEVPLFPEASVPTEAEWEDAMSWAMGKGMLAGEVSYSESVNAALLP